MLAHSQDFKQSITDYGREIDAKITYYGGNGYLATQDNKLVLTEDNLKILMEENQDNEVRLQLDGDSIYKLEKNNLGELFRTYMKSFDLETTTELNVGSIVNVEIGCKVNNAFEYLDYGEYIIYTKNYKEDTKTYEYQLCDYMLKTMIPFKWDEIVIYNNEVLDETTMIDLVDYICTYCGLTNGISSLINGSNDVYKITFDGFNLTCRDVLDMIAQASGLSLITNNITLETLDWNRQSVDTIDEDNLKNTNVSFSEKFGPLNSLVISRLDGNDNIAKKDDTSIAQYGETQYYIENNLILEQDNRSDFLNDLFDQIKSLEYYECNLDLVGLEYLEYLDRFDVEIGDNTYNCICLENTSLISSGLTENITSKKPIEKKEEYVKEGLDDKKASIEMDKMKGQIVLKTYVDSQDGKTKIAQVRLDSSGEDGSLITIEGDQIDLSGKNINLTGDDITISSTKFNVSKDGDVVCSNMDITGGSFNIYADTSTNSRLKLTSWNDNNYYLENCPGLIRMHKSNGDIIRLESQGPYGQLQISNLNTNISTIINPQNAQLGNLSARNIDSGRCTLNSSSETWVSFNKTFDGEPNVVITPKTTTSGVIAVKVRSVYTTGFNAIIGGSGFSSIECSWIAIW